MLFINNCRGIIFGNNYNSKMNLNRIEFLRRGIYLQKNYRNKESIERSTEKANIYVSENTNYWNNLWEEKKYFSAQEDDAKNSFKMILPPPNVTGVLHLGHALTCTVQDILVRWRRMNGQPVIWIPGLDHAGIATQAVVENYLRKTQGRGRYELGKEDFLSCMKEWKDKKGDAIKHQLKSLGSSLDWSKEFFTMSKEHNEAVTEAFVLLNERELLYRKNALVNWSPNLRSTISDMEIEHVRITGKTDFVVPGYEKKIPFGLMANIALKIRDSDEEITIATTRVESMPGDVAIAVNPEDSRYSRYIGREIWHPIRKTFLPIIEDASIKTDFGTGAVKITPAHDHLDLEIANRHNLEIIDVIGNDGNMTENAKPFQGLGRFIAREKILEELSRQGSLKSLEDHEMLVPVCSRSGDIVEYLKREQWFLKTKKMAERAAEAVKNGSLKIDPPEWEKLWCTWLGSNRDWCVSRQIWWGHRIPAYRSENSDWIIARNEEEARRKLVKDGDTDLKIEQDQDVLDTWFSSALLPMTSAGWPDRKFEKFYPLSLMETGYDIIFLWVARMVMLGTELTNALPFKEILFHGVLCDSDGKKMSKSRGNVIRPEHVINGISLEKLNAEAEESFQSGILSKLELKRTLNTNGKKFPDGIPECGIDALRLTLCSQNVRNIRISFDVVECQTNKRFCNKIWQATNYILRMTEESKNPVEKRDKLSLMDQWILSRLSFMVFTVNESLEERNFHKAVRAFKQFFYYEFCDFFLEGTKPAFKKQQKELIDSHGYTLSKCLEVSLRILAPITPYLCEDLYRKCLKKLPNVFKPVPSLFEANYPNFSGDCQKLRQLGLEKRFDHFLDVVRIVRNVLTQVSKKSDVKIYVVTESDEDYFTEYLNLIEAITRIKNIRVLESRDYAINENSLLCGIVGSECRIFLQLASKEDAALVREKIKKKRLQFENKLENYLRITAQSKSAEKPESERLRDQEMIENLKEELKRYPKFA